MARAPEHSQGAQTAHDGEGIPEGGRRYLEISGHDAEAIRAHGRARLPEECCGLLLGQRDGDSFRVRAVERVKNQEAGDRSARFRIAPVDFVAAQRRAAGRGQEVVGFYHSHPEGPPHPSVTDLQYAWAGMAYVIVSFDAGRGGDIGAFALTDDSPCFAALGIREVSHG